MPLDKNEHTYLETFEVTAPSPEEAEDLISTLGTMLGDTATKGLLVLLSEKNKGTVSADVVASLCDLLQSAPIPTAAVFESDASVPTKKIAATCLFQFSANEATLDETMQQAEVYLDELVARRPRHVIAAVLQSLRNADVLPIEAALLEETKLFCELSLRNRTAVVEDPQ